MKYTVADLWRSRGLLLPVAPAVEIFLLFSPVPAYIALFLFRIIDKAQWFTYIDMNAQQKWEASERQRIVRKQSPKDGYCSQRLFSSCHYINYKLKFFDFLFCPKHVTNASSAKRLVKYYNLQKLYTFNVNCRHIRYYTFCKTCFIKICSTLYIIAKFSFIKGVHF